MSEKPCVRLELPEGFFDDDFTTETTTTSWGDDEDLTVRKTFTLTRYGQTPVFLGAPDEGRRLVLSVDDFDSLGCPDKITVTVEAN